MSIFSEGAYVKLKHRRDLPSHVWGVHGIIVQTASEFRPNGTIGVVIVKWDNPNMIGSFVATDFLEISSPHTLYLGDYGVFSKE